MISAMAGSFSRIRREDFGGSAGGWSRPASRGAHVTRTARTPPRPARVLGSLLLVAAAGAFTLGAAPAPPEAPVTPLNQVVPAPASVTPGGAPYRLTRATAVRVDGSAE